MGLTMAWAIFSMAGIRRTDVSAPPERYQLSQKARIFL